MQVCTTTIFFKEHPLVWEYDKKTDTATFLFLLTETRENYDKSALIAYLNTLNLEGLEIGEELTKEGQTKYEITISQAKKFFESYPIIPIIEYQLKSKISPLISAQIKQEQEKDSPKRNRSQTLPSLEERSSIELDLPRHSSAPETDSTVERIGLWLNHIIPESTGASSIWARTRCYEDYFGRKLEEDLSRLQFITTNMTVFIKEHTHPKNKELYKIKSKQMELIRELFDEILAPLHEEIQPHYEIDAEIIKYFQTVIEKVMVNDPDNLGPTDLETLRESKQLIRYKGDREKLNAAIEESRIERANSKMLKPLLFFVQDNIESSSLSSECEQVQQLLDKLKLAIKEKNLINRVENLLVQLGKLTAQSGQTEDRHKDNETLITQQIQEKKALIGKSSYSCYQMLFNLLDKKFKFRDKKKESLIKEISTELFGAIVETINTTMEAEIQAKIIPKIFPENGDFYFCEDWYTKLSEELEQVLSQIKLPSLEVVKENQEELISKIHNYTIGFIKRSLERAKQPKELVITPSSQSTDKRDVISLSRSRGASKSLPSLSTSEKSPLASRLTVNVDRIHRPPVSPRASIKDRDEAQINRESFFSGKPAPQRKEAAKHLHNQTKDVIMKPGPGPSSSN